MSNFNKYVHHKGGPQNLIFGNDLVKVTILYKKIANAGEFVDVRMHIIIIFSGNVIFLALQNSILGNRKASTAPPPQAKPPAH